MNDPDRPLSVLQAARAFSGKREPTASEIHMIEGWLELGLLRGTKHGGLQPRWTTTVGAIADFMANEANERYLKNQSRKPVACQTPLARRSGPSQSQSQKMETLYRDVWAEYFLAVIARGRRRNTGKHFQTAVVLGQLALLVAIVLGGFFLVRTAVGQLPAEEVAVRQWLQQNVGEFTITKCHSPKPNPEGSGSLVRTCYRYCTPAGRTVETDRMFFVENDRVVRVDSQW